MTTIIRVGHVVLTDVLPLLAIKYLELDRQAHIDLQLIKMGSWAQLRDALLTGDINAAHCLPGIPLYSQTGAYDPISRLATAFTLNHFGNAITLSQSLIKQIHSVPSNPRRDGTAGNPPGICKLRLREISDARRLAGNPLRFASVFPVSKHEFELRYWLRLHGLDVRDDVELLVIPPARMVDELRKGSIDGFCVGEPWNSVALDKGVGQVVASSRSLGLPGTEKVLAVDERWLDSDAHHGLLPLLHQASSWIAQPANRAAALNLLAKAVEVKANTLVHGVVGPYAVDFSAPHCPDRHHALWLLEQMRDAGHIRPDQVNIDLARKAFRSDIYESCLLSP